MSFTATYRVEFRDTDAAGIMHFSTFFTYMEEVEHAFLRHLGFSVVMEDAEGQISWPRVSAGCDYRDSLKFEDEFQVAIRLTRLGEKSVTYEFAFTSGGRAVAEGRTVAVCCRIVPGQPPQSITIPPEIVEKLAAVLVTK